jgi:hypothetical protein
LNLGSSSNSSGVIFPVPGPVSNQLLGSGSTSKGVNSVGGSY